MSPKKGGGEDALQAAIARDDDGGDKGPNQRPSHFSLSTCLTSPGTELEIPRCGALNWVGLGIGIFE
jgi:hypothetical protein